MLRLAAAALLVGCTQGSPDPAAPEERSAAIAGEGVGNNSAELVVVPPPARRVSRFPALTGSVVDTADILDADAEEALSDQALSLEKSTGHELVVVTLPSLGCEPIERYGMALGNHWGIGREAFDDGVLLIVAPNERRVRIEVGKGLEDERTDAEADTILQTAVLPPFRQGAYRTGIEGGVAGIIREIGSDE